ncbi:MAG TPA: glycosyltransferase family 2 protein [Vicinamibacterales bacterium]|nr:glycosyltransferase family 2 protein [Vicinamibacterales bacterium]
MEASYILPIRTDTPAPDELISYVRDLASRCEVIVVDGSSAPVFASFGARCGAAVRHVRPDVAFSTLANGKVAGVMTGLRLASHDRIVVADDDVRYDTEALERVVCALGDAEVVRPQNYFDPLPWHARVDTARSLINRVTGGDWPGTLAVRRSVLLRTGGYDGNVLFENLELVRTVLAAGGRESAPRDLYVRRLPPTSDHFVSQRVRQAYDEIARPLRLAAWLSLLPLFSVVARAGGARAVTSVLALFIVPAEIGRRIGGGTRVFPATTAVVAPVWICERALTAWLAVGARAVLGGVPYRGRILRTAATPMRKLRRRHAPRG